MLHLRVCIVLLGAVVLISCTPEPPEPDVTRQSDGQQREENARWPSSGTTAMVASLRQLRERADPEANVFLNRRRADGLRKMLERPLSPRETFDLRVHYGLELLRAGDSREAARILEETTGVLDSLPEDDSTQRDRWVLHQFAGIAHLRIAEQSNCLAGHSADACVLPLRGGGLHRDHGGSESAIAAFLAALEIHPRDLRSLWLLNIAAMTLGRHPAGLPEPYRIARSAFESPHRVTPFVDVGGPAGVAATGLSGGAALEDFDGDGLLDIFCTSWGLSDSARFFRNLGDGRFEDRSGLAGLEGITGGLNLEHADFDNDGDFDVLVLRGAWMRAEGRHPNSLLVADGAGGFVDGTRAAGLLAFHPTQTAEWVDYNGDGWLDLFIGNESDDEVHSPCELWHNSGDGTFERCARLQGLDIEAYVKGVTWGDIDDDGDPDLYLSCLGEANRLFRNDGPRAESQLPASDTGRRPRAEPVRPWVFTDITQEAGVEEPLKSFPTWFFDYDQDGRLDLFVASYEWEDSVARVAADFLGIDHQMETSRLYHNEGDGKFRDRTAELGLDDALIVMGGNYGDIDGDGYPDIYLGTGEPDFSALMPNRLYWNDRGRRFVDATSSSRLGHLQKGHGIAFGDIDRDGDLDIYAVLGGAYEGDVFRNALFENRHATPSHVTMRLRGLRSNRAAVGARVQIELVKGKDRRSVFRRVSTGGSFGCSTHEITVGLQEGESVARVLVRWPLRGAETEEFSGIVVGTMQELVEGEGQAHTLPSRGFTFWKE